MPENQNSLPLPDKKIPFAIMIIGTFEIMIGLLGLMIVFLWGGANLLTLSYSTLSIIYIALGGGLWAIQEWARSSSVILQGFAIPYALYTSLVLDGGPSGLSQIIVAIFIIYALTRPEIKHKFQTVVPKAKQH